MSAVVDIKGILLLYDECMQIAIHRMVSNIPCLKYALIFYELALLFVGYLNRIPHVCP